MWGFGPASAWATTGKRAFKLVRGGSTVGTHTLDVATNGDLTEMRIAIDIAIKFMGLTAYRYTHRNAETWRAGRLIALDATTNDDGTEDFVKATLEGERLRVTGSGFDGLAPPDVAPTSYWAYDAMIANATWISTQSGKPLSVSLDRRPENGGERVLVEGLGRPTTLIYDAAREWRSCVFDAGGQDIVYEETSAGPNFRDLVSA